VAFAAVGASTFAHLSAGAGVPWFFAILIAGLAAVPFGAVISIPAIRLSGLFLALATFGFGILLSQVGYRSFLMFGSSNGIVARRPSLPGLHLNTDTGYYYVILAVVVGCVAIVNLVERARLGRILRAMADSPLALSTHGTSVNVTRALVFCVSSFIAGISGALFAPLNGVVTGTTFPYFNSVALLAVLAVATFSLRRAGNSVVLASFAAAFLLEVLPGYITSATFALYLQVIFGASAMIAAVAAGSGRSIRGLTSRLDRSRRGPVTDRLTRLGLERNGDVEAATSPDQVRVLV
jgi:ABC-type branched-subunit amino acid transport system permease subunit